ncbi:MAG: PLDc N-terminal domain-containing protein [Minisyncoccota bacterium]
MKTIKKSTTFLVSVLGLIAVANHVALASTKCTVNGQEVDCAELGNQVKGFLGWGIGGFLVIIALGVWATAFWIMMIVHLARHKVEDKVMWIILMVFTGIVGALIYYFVVKRKFNKSFSPPIPVK